MNNNVVASNMYDVVCCDDLIFEEAIQNVAELWRTIGLGVYSGNTQYMTKIGTWNLDTGMNDNNQLVYWG